MQSFIIFLSFFFQLFACRQAEERAAIDPLVQRYVHLLGSSRITVKKTTYGTPSNLLFIQLHDNEQTAEKAALKLLEESGGTIISIENGGKRTLSFLHRGKKYVFDPNRMFSRKGIRESMQRLGSYNSVAAIEAQKFSAALLKLIPKDGIVIALHNNTDLNYSILSYTRDPFLKQSAKAFHRNKTLDTDNFFITTDSSLFHLLKRKNFNVILQNNTKAYEDGSLSVYMGKISRTYVNVEAQHGHLQEQTRMLKSLIQQVKTLN